jgi:hypothetical protein
LIELACDALHGGVIEIFTIGHHGERVAGERSLCENVDKVKRDLLDTAAHTPRSLVLFAT